MITKLFQILVSDIWALFEGKGSGQFNDIDSLTMFADYRVPQSLQVGNYSHFFCELYRVFQRSGQAKLCYGGLVLGLCQFPDMIQLPQIMKLNSKVVRSESKIICTG
jgi:hypothetical protein